MLLWKMRYVGLYRGRTLVFLLSWLPPQGLLPVEVVMRYIVVLDRCQHTLSNTLL